MQRNRKKKLSITYPDVRTAYFGKGIKQKGRYLQLPKCFSKDLLEKDVKAGAGIYESFLETLKLNESRYNVILAPTEEDGLRAVEYLACVHAAEALYDESDWEEELPDAVQEKADFDDIACTIEELLGTDEEDDEDEDDDSCEEEEDTSGYVENFSRVPVIDLPEVVMMEHWSRPTFGYGMFNMQPQTNTKQAKPWWDACEGNAVCLIATPRMRSIFDTEVLQEQDIECMQRFSQNEHVYVVLVGDSISEEDCTVIKLLLTYTANCFKVEADEKKRQEYYQILLREEAKKREFTFSKSLDYGMLTEKLAKVDGNYPCAYFSKVMDYLVHINAPKCLHAKDFDRMGLKKLLEKITTDSPTMEKELVGMEPVKKQINNIIHTLRYVRLRQKKNLTKAGYHNVHLFIGAPGTAKTTMAKLMANTLQQEGLLPGNRFISVTGAQLKAPYVGQTAPKVHALFEQYDAIFIDEAYSLTASCDSKMDTFSQEALAQLAVELEDHAMDKLIIFAGYGGKAVSRKNNLMKEFLEANPGISSRINSTVYFDSYTPDNMVEIVHRLAELSKYTLGTGMDQQIADYFQSREHEEDFGNGREARMFLEQCERSAAERVAQKKPDHISDRELCLLKREDVENAIRELQLKREAEQGKAKNRFGFV